MPADLNLSNLEPAQPRRGRKRVGRGLGSGKGRYAGRGRNGQKSRAGSHTMRAGFEGGQMPLYMRLGKQRGPTSKDAMPMGPHRTFAQGVNVRELERVFEAGAEVAPESLRAKGLIPSTRIDVKILGDGELSRKLTVWAHGFSVSAVRKIEAAGGTVNFLRDPVERKKKRPRRTPAPPAEAEPTPAAEADAEAPEAHGE